MRVVMLLVFVLGALGGCKSHEDVEFRGIRNTVISGSDGSNVIVNADAVLFNPNDVKGRVRFIDVMVKYKDKEVATVTQVGKTTVPRNAEFTIPLVLHVDMKKLNDDFLSQLSSILSRRGVELEFVGNVKVSIHGFRYKVPVNHRENITF